MDDRMETLESVLDRMANRTSEEMETTGDLILAASPPSRELPVGKTLFDVAMGHWPGNETDEQVFDALERLS